MSCRITIAMLFLFSQTVMSQVRTLTLEDCYSLARQNYPLIRKQQLIHQSSEYSIKNASKLFLPQLNISGQATYQTETVGIPEGLFPNAGRPLPELSRDQYRIQAEINQQIYDGGNTRNQKQLASVEEAVEMQSLEINLYTLRERVTDIFFSILLIDEQLRQNEIRITDLKNAADKAESAYRNGTAYKSNVDELKAEIANAGMATIEFQNTRLAFIEMLRLLTNISVDTSLELKRPEAPQVSSDINRPELKLLDNRKQLYDLRDRQLNSDLRPRFSAFLQGGYGRPTPNILENQFGPWIMTGIKLNWNIGSLYALRNNRELLNINRQYLDLDKETFLFNTNLSVRRQNGTIRKYRELLAQDEEAILLRRSVRASAQAQLDNGIITVHEYINKLNAENNAVQLKIIHSIQLLLSQYNLNIITGN